MSTAPPVQCLSCKHLHKTASDPSIAAGLPQVVTCDAYPRRIPKEIAGQGADHRESRGDEVDGVTHELDPGKRRLFESWRRTFAPTDAELAQRRLTMAEPVDIVFIED